jgi:hypothetical protein
MKQTRQAVHAFKQSILLRCLWVISSLLVSYVCTQMFVVYYRHLWFVPAKGFQGKEESRSMFGSSLMAFNDQSNFVRNFFFQS